MTASASRAKCYAGGGPRSSEGLGRTLGRDGPEVLDVFELPHGFEPLVYGYEAMALIERLGNHFFLEGVQPQAPTGVLFGPLQQQAPYAAALATAPNVQLTDRLAGGGDEAK